MDYLKSKTVEIKSIGESLVLKQLSYGAWHEIIHEEDTHKSMAMMCQRGVPDWKDKPIEEIAGMLNPEQVKEISEAIQDLGGIPKNSDSTPSDDSSSN